MKHLIPSTIKTQWNTTIEKTKTYIRAHKKIVSIAAGSVAVIAMIGGGWFSWQAIQAQKMIEDITIITASGTTVENCIKSEKYSIPVLKKPEHENLWNALSSMKDMCKNTPVEMTNINYHYPENDFLSSFALDFVMPIFQTNDTPGTDEYRAKQEVVRELIRNRISFIPYEKIQPENIEIYDRKIVLSVALLPETRYTVSLDAEVKKLGAKDGVWEFETPKNQTLILRTRERVTLYNTNHPPVLEVLGYNVEKKNRTLSVCPISLENFGKVEVFLKNHDISPTQSGAVKTDFVSQSLTPQQEFFYSGIDTLLGDKKGCVSLDASFAPETNGPLQKTEIPLAETMRKLGNTGLYVVVFDAKEDRHFNDRTQPPLLLGSINAHITMKVGQNGEAFFLVTDFDGNPVSDMDISTVLGDFSSQSVRYDGNGRKVDLISPLDKNVFGKNIVLGRTDKNGVLRTQLRGKVDEYFMRTFQNQYEFDETGRYPSFFVTGTKKGFTSYVSSQWNSGIAPWNFGYQVNSWYDSSGMNTDNLMLTQWNQEWFYNAHLFAERVLYLPGETVMIKGVIRKNGNLSVPTGEKFTLIITDNEGREVQRNTVAVNEFGSILGTYALPKSAQLGSYFIILQDNEGREFARTGFTVEVFKNPKFRTDIQLRTEGLSGEEVEITEKGRKKEYYYYDTVYSGKFTIQADLIGRYYSGGVLGDTPFDYKVYRQEYFDTSYWADCYYGCFWEPQKEFYTEGRGTFDKNGAASISIPVEFSSAYSDYRYIVEVSPRDAAGDIVSSTNSIIARLPEEYKLWNPNSGIEFKSEKRFYPAGTKVRLTGKLNYGTWSENHEDKFLLIIKKKEFETKIIKDVRGYDRPVSTPKETLVDILPVSKKDFQITKEGEVSIDYPLPDTAEYIFQFGKINSELLRTSGVGMDELARDLEKAGTSSIEKNTTVRVDATTDLWTLATRCIGDEYSCSREAILQNIGCDVISNEACLEGGHTVRMKQRFTLDDLIVGRQFISLLTYSEEEAKNPVISDNKLRVLSEKVSYKIGEKARILVQLPFSNGKILWTVEKKGVEKSEIIDVKGNTFFREITVDESFAPNAYIGIIALDTDNKRVPEYKVGYTEIVIDKTDKKSDVKITSDKTTYAPREKVTLNIQVDNKGTKKKHEVAVMVIDDSLISLMGNIDRNTLEKIWIKLPFQIQTSLTNVAMLRNFYFARPGIVGGSGALDQKGGDSKESTRTIFKNTAYYNGRVITDETGKAIVSFTLPDNLTQFRVMAVTNARDNTFGTGESTFEVKKPVTLEDKTPLILRDGDTLTLGANVFNQTGKDIELTVSLNAPSLIVNKNAQKISLKNGANTFVSFPVQIKEKGKDITYTMSASGDSDKNSDTVEGTITWAESPTLIQRVIRDDVLEQGKQTYTLDVPGNTLLARSSYEMTLSTNPLQHLEKIIGSLLVYPYGCIEQTVSTTVPNMLALEFASYFPETRIDKKVAQKSLEDGLLRIQKMQTESGGFGYWEGDTTADITITPYVVRSLLLIQRSGYKVDQTMIAKAIDYLSSNILQVTDETQKVEIFYALALAGKGQTAYDTLYLGKSAPTGRHNKLIYTYGLFLTNKEKFQKEIEKNISALSVEIKKDTNEYSWYWDRHSDIALFLKLLMDMNGDKRAIYTGIKELGNRDYESYYMSTQSKNMAFITFLEFMKKYGDETTANVVVTQGDGAPVSVDLRGSNVMRSVMPLSAIEKNGTVAVTAENTTTTPVFVSLRIQSYPADITKIEPYSHGVTIERTMYEIIDTKKFAECSSYSWYMDERKDCEKAFRKITPNKVQKGKTYKIVLKATMQENMYRNFTLEDYLPATFRVLKSNFRTDSIATGQSTTGWTFNRVEVRPEVIMAHAAYLWGKEATYEYFVIPEFSGTFVYPPATAYLMYNPDIRAYGRFGRITVTE